ncbi:MAG TPA: hypothetical protein VF696_00530, partial [Candidatus Paceibacterota bacterium]
GYQAPPVLPQAAASAPQPYPSQPSPVYAHPSAPAYTPPPITAPVRLTPVDRTYGRAPITKEFGSDPYREPIEYELGKG